MIFNIHLDDNSKPRPEVNGVDYFFVSKEEFEHQIQTGGMLEYAKYVDNYYGTPLKYVNETLDSEKMFSLRLKLTEQCKCAKVPRWRVYFLNPPDLDELKQRLIHRGTDSMEVTQTNS